MKLVLPNCRARLTEADFNFIVSVFQSNPNDKCALVHLLGDAETRDLLLDEKALFKALLETPAYLRISLSLYFYIVVRHMLMDAGIDDRTVADYIASVLVRFAKRLPHPAKESATEPHFYVVDILEEIDRADPQQRFYLVTYLGNQALVLTSVFSDHIEYRARYRAAPELEYYESVGRVQFQAASRHHLAMEFELDQIYATISDSFRTVRTALNDMQSRILFLGEPDVANFLI